MWLLWIRWFRVSHRRTTFTLGFLDPMILGFLSSENFHRTTFTLRFLDSKIPEKHIIMWLLLYIRAIPSWDSIGLSAITDVSSVDFPCGRKSHPCVDWESITGSLHENLSPTISPGIYHQESITDNLSSRMIIDNLHWNLSSGMIIGNREFITDNTTRIHHWQYSLESIIGNSSSTISLTVHPPVISRIVIAIIECNSSSRHSLDVGNNELSYCHLPQRPPFRSGYWITLDRSSLVSSSLGITISSDSITTAGPSSPSPLS